MAVATKYIAYIFTEALGPILRICYFTNTSLVFSFMLNGVRKLRPELY